MIHPLATNLSSTVTNDKATTPGIEAFRSGALEATFLYASNSLPPVFVFTTMDMV